MMTSTELTVIVDLFIFSLCCLLLWRYGRLSHSHPGTIYLLFHGLVVTFRFWAIAGGAPTLFSDWGWNYYPVDRSEIIRAVYMADLALIMMTVAWLRVANATQLPVEIGVEQTSEISLRIVWSVVVFAFPIGLAGLILFSNIPGIDNDTISFSGWERSAWFTMTQTWSGLSLLALLYTYGFVWWLLLPFALYLMLMLYQGFHRFRVIIPLILLVQIYLDLHRRRWPSLTLLAAVITMGFLFYPMKYIGRLAQEGAAPTEIWQAVSTIVLDATRGEAKDQQFLDQFASAVTLIDGRDQFYYGRTYLSILTLPIPRPLWPEKPGLADHMHDFSTPWRPMAETGMIITYLGELYANFGYIGIIVGPYVIAHLLARFYFSAYRRPYNSPRRFAYLLLAANLLQVYRDGLTSIVVFTFVNMMPVIVILLLHRFSSRRPTRVMQHPNTASYSASNWK